MLSSCGGREDSWISLDSKEIKPVNPKGNQPWILIGRTVAEAEAPTLGPLGANSWFFRKDPDAGKDRVQEEKGTTEDEMVAWHHWLNGSEFEQTQGNSEGQRILACCSSWGHKESRHDLATEQQHKSECTIRHPKTGIDAVGYIKPELRIPISKRYLKALKWGSKYTLPPRR